MALVIWRVLVTEFIRFLMLFRLAMGAFPSFSRL
jgi:hypothetical protein